MKMHIKPLSLAFFIAANALALQVNAAEESVQLRDPARWSVPDSTPQARFATMKKENTNAYAQAMNDCRAIRSREAADCKREARSNFDQDMQRARAMTIGRRR